MWIILYFIFFSGCGTCCWEDSWHKKDFGTIKTRDHSSTRLPAHGYTSPQGIISALLEIFGMQSNWQRLYFLPVCYGSNLLQFSSQIDLNFITYPIPGSGVIRIGPLTGAALIEKNEASAKLTTANGGTFTWAQLDSVANHVTAHSIGDWRALTWLATATG